ncbi:MAG: hypothetical protein QM811_24040 [Pirellulales bacterium]
MEVEFELTKEDYYAFNRYHQIHSPVIRRRYYRVWIVTTVSLLMLSGLSWLLLREGDPLLRNYLSLGFLIGASSYATAYPWLYQRNLREIIEGMISEGRSNGLFSSLRIGLGPEAVSSIGELRRSATDWARSNGSCATGPRVYIYINAISAHIVPRRAFDSDLRFEHFAETAERFRAARVAQFAATGNPYLSAPA